MRSEQSERPEQSARPKQSEQPGRPERPGPSEQIRRWESGALAHAVTDPFGQGPLPWLRGSEHYFDDTGHIVPWYVDPAPPPGATTTANRRRATGGPAVPA
ncbi:hypothetical protein HO151_06340, partial [Streptomyces sp. 8P21H-1]|nr:hypothetical protein [Streptomyces sp. 8P21H-1]